MEDHSLQQAIAALKAGERKQARTLLAQLLRREPGNEQAWFWMSGAVDTDADRLMCLRQALAINPINERARQGVELLERKGVRMPVVTPRQPAQPVPPPPPPNETRLHEQAQDIENLPQAWPRAEGAAGHEGDAAPAAPEMPNWVDEAHAPESTRATPYEVESLVDEMMSFADAAPVAPAAVPETVDELQTSELSEASEVLEAPQAAIETAEISPTMPEATQEEAVLEAPASEAVIESATLPDEPVVAEEAAPVEAELEPQALMAEELTVKGLEQAQPLEAMSAETLEAWAPSDEAVALEEAVASEDTLASEEDTLLADIVASIDALESAPDAVAEPAEEPEREEAEPLELFGTPEGWPSIPDEAEQLELAEEDTVQAETTLEAQSATVEMEPWTVEAEAALEVEPVTLETEPMTTTAEAAAVGEVTTPKRRSPSRRRRSEAEAEAVEEPAPEALASEKMIAEAQPLEAEDEATPQAERAPVEEAAIAEAPPAESAPFVPPPIPEGFVLPDDPEAGAEPEPGMSLRNLLILIVLLIIIIAAIAILLSQRGV